MRIGILGAGLSGLTAAYSLQGAPGIERIDLLEKEHSPGGLCRSFAFGNTHYDIGPHIIFSKDAEVLALMVELLGDNVHRLRRSNRIFHDGRFVKYPFENELSALSEQDREYCLNTFLANPYAEYVPQNMLQFFLTVFGEGITNLYLRPYNEKIWKFDPSLMDTQIVERIPKPPPQDIINSAKGIVTEGYVHQLWFHYPRSGGIASLIAALLGRLGPKVAIRTGAEVAGVEQTPQGWRVATTDGQCQQFDRLISTIPVALLIRALGATVPEEVSGAARALRHNSILLCMLRVRRDQLGDNFAVMVADKSIIFHRLSKLDFLAPPHAGAAGAPTTLMAEVTYRAGDLVDLAPDPQVMDRVVADLCRLGFIAGPEEIEARELRRFPHAYVIYDLDHRRNMNRIRAYCEEQLGLWLLGRFGEFEYWNMDQVIRRAIARSKEILQSDALAPSR